MIGIFVVLLIFWDKPSVEGTSQAEPGGGDVSVPGGFPSIPGTPGTTATTLLSSLSQSPGSSSLPIATSSPGQGPMPTTGPTTVLLTSPSPDAKLLVCTFGKYGVLPAMVPDDGICNIIFYTDVFYDDKKRELRAMYSPRALEVLEQVMQNYKRTTFGTSMVTGLIGRYMGNDSVGVKAAIGNSNQRGFRHYGMLNVGNFEAYNKHGDLQYLTEACAQAKRQTPKGHCALGVSLHDGALGEEILNRAELATRDFPDLTMVIIKIHIEDFFRGVDIYPVGPNPDYVSLRNYKRLSFAMIRTGLKQRLDVIGGDGTRYVMLSFAMYVRAYRMHSNWKAVNTREKAIQSIAMDYTTVCKLQVENDGTIDNPNIYVADVNTKFLGMFDNIDTFKRKTKDRLKSMPDKKVGMAAYNVEMDDYYNDCARGKFGRLEAIKDALH